MQYTRLGNSDLEVSRICIAELTELTQTVYERSADLRMAKAQMRIENEILTSVLQAIRCGLSGAAHDLASAVLAGRLTPCKAVECLRRQVSVSQLSRRHEGAGDF